MSYMLTVHLPGGTVMEIKAQAGETVHRALTRVGVYIDAPCGGRRLCGKCLVRLKGAVTEPDEDETALIPKGSGLRLACFAVILGDCEVFLNAAPGGALIMEDGNAANFSFGSCDDPAGNIGAAVDIGTTTVVAYLYDRCTGLKLGVKSGMNAQRPHGADVISRISYCIEQPAGLEQLRGLICGQVSGLIADLTEAAGRKTAEVGYITVAGNTTMQHIFAGRSPAGMAAAPFTPETLFGAELPADGLITGVSADARVYILPAVAGYVGGDITAAILASGMNEKEGTWLLLDIGTNGEMALGGVSGLSCCATAAGPAFEGAGISRGMGGTTGAISSVTLSDGRLTLSVIGGGKPAGICGSGLIDALAVMLRLGAVDETGRLLPPDEAENPVAAALLSEDEDGVRFALDEEAGIYITEKDVRELQLAKAAVAAGIRTLLRESGKDARDVQGLYLAGGFGSYINKESAAEIGLFPRELLMRVDVIGNGAGMGAIAALTGPAARERLGNIARACRYIELSGSAIYMEEYVNEMMFA